VVLVTWRGVASEPGHRWAVSDDWTIVALAGWLLTASAVWRYGRSTLAGQWPSIDGWGTPVVRDREREAGRKHVLTPVRGFAMPSRGSSCPGRPWRELIAVCALGGARGDRATRPGWKTTCGPREAVRRLLCALDSSARFFRDPGGHTVVKVWGAFLLRQLLATRALDARAAGRFRRKQLA
jgi:hypothetical protein